jgi:hypothetical protein
MWPVVRSRPGIERTKTKGVEKTMMQRAKLILSLLIPALWLAGALGSFNERATGSAVFGAGKSLSAAGHKHDLSTSASSFDQAIRRAARRPTIQLASDKVLTPAIIGQALVHLRNLPFDTRDHSGDTFGLAQSWQFRWRAALQPRAPSSVS